MTSKSAPRVPSPSRAWASRTLHAVTSSVLVFLAAVGLVSGQELPSIGVISPAPDSNVIGADVTVEVVVTDFTLVPPTGTDANPGEGHIIYFLDFEPPFIPGQSAIPDDPNVVYAATHETSHTFQDVQPGSHEVFVLLVLDNHCPVFPPAADKVSFTSTATPAPGSSPTPTATPQPQPSPAATETARSINIEETPPPVPSSSPTPAILPVQIPSAGSPPNGSADILTGWFILAAVVGGVILAISAIFIAKWARPH